MNDLAARLERYDTLFIAPHGDDVALACPARVLAEAARTVPRTSTTTRS